MPSWFSSPSQRNRVILVTAVVTLVVVVIIAAWAAIVPFMLGMIVTYIILPAVNWLDAHAPRLLQRKSISRPLAIIIVYLLMLGLFVGLMAFFIPAVLAQAKGFGNSLPRYLEQLEQLFVYDISGFLERVPPEISEPLNANIERAMDTLVNAIQKGVGGTLRTLWQTVSFVIGLAIVPFWMFYVLNDHRRIKRSIYALLPEAVREDVRNIENLVDSLLSSYVRGQLILCVVVGSLATIVLFIFGIDLALLLGTFAGIFEIIPILGPYLGAIPAVLIVFLTEPINALWMALSFAGIQWVENTFLVPRITGNAVRLHPALVMLLVVIASQLGGIVGMFVVVPLAAILRDVVSYLYLRTTERGATPALAMESIKARIR